MKHNYDVAMSPDFLLRVQKRRSEPDGRLLYTKLVRRGKTRVFDYPWHLMQLGDFFFAPLLGRRPDVLATRFRQVAARKDWELTILQRNDPKGVSSLRVCLTVIGITALKQKAQRYHGVRDMTFGDGRWSETRARRKAAKEELDRPQLKKRTEAVVYANTKAPHQRFIDEPDDPPATPEDWAPLAPDVLLPSADDRDAVLRNRLRLHGVEQ